MLAAVVGCDREGPLPVLSVPGSRQVRPHPLQMEPNHVLAIRPVLGLAA